MACSRHLAGPLKARHHENLPISLLGFLLVQSYNDLAYHLSTSSQDLVDFFCVVMPRFHGVGMGVAMAAAPALWTARGGYAPGW